MRRVACIDPKLLRKTNTIALLSDALDLPKPFGPYTLLRRLAVGGMAEVYVAKTRGIGGFEKLVGIKVIHPRFSEDEHFVQMLVEEAKITVQLNHVNIAQTFDLGCIDDTYYIAMEYVEGADAFRVENRARDKKLAIPVDICVHVAAEICNGLSYAHRKRDAQGDPLGIVHRDISPQNVLISYTGEVKLVDFGIAKAALRGGQTEVGVIKGKYYYMSPEQAWGDPVDQRTDVFACGLLLHELLTGEMVYQEDNVPALLDKVRKAAVPSPRLRRRDVPAELEAVLMKAVAKEASDRHQSAHAFGQELTRVLYQINPTFAGSRLAQLMGTLFPEEVRRHSQMIKLPPADEVSPPSEEVELAPLSRDEFGLSAEPSVIFDLAEGDDSTRNDILPFRRAKPKVEPSRSDRATRELVDPSPAGKARTRQQEPTAPRAARNDQWEDETLLKNNKGWDDSTLIEDDGKAMAEVMRLLGSRPMAGDGEPDELAGEKTVAMVGFPDEPPEAPPLQPIAAPPVAAMRPAPPRPPARPIPAPARPPVRAAPPVVVGLPELPAERTLALAPESLPSGAYVLDAAAEELPPERTVALAPEASVDLQPEKTVAFSGSGPLPVVPKRQGALAGPSKAGVRLGPEADRFFNAPGTSGEAPSAAPVDPFGGFAPPGPDPFTAPPPAHDPFVAQPGLGVEEDALGKPEPRRWILPVILGLLVIAGLVAGGVWFASRTKPTSLEIISVPEGATVRVDGQSHGTTPVTIPNLEPGRTYRVELQRAGYEPREADFAAREGPNRSVFLLNQIRVSLHIETQPSGAQVWVDNVLRGSAPLDIPGLAVGQTVLLRSSAPGHETVARELVLQEADRAPSIVLELPATPPR